jgi:hypothetical protein
MYLDMASVQNRLIKEYWTDSSVMCGLDLTGSEIIPVEGL